MDVPKAADRSISRNRRSIIGRFGLSTCRDIANPATAANTFNQTQLEEHGEIPPCRIFDNLHM